MRKNGTSRSAKGGADVNPCDVLTCRRAGEAFGLPESTARRVFRARVAAGDTWPLRVHGAVA